MKVSDFAQVLLIFNKLLPHQAEIQGDPSKVKVCPTLYTVIGHEIKRRRLEIGITQVEASQVLRIGRTSLTNIENGNQRCTLDTLYLLAALFDCTIHDLLPRNFPSDK